MSLPISFFIKVSEIKLMNVLYFQQTVPWKILNQSLPLAVLEVASISNHRSILFCYRFLQACNAFLVNTISMKLATAFVISRLLQVNNEESWSNISICCLSYKTVWFNLHVILFSI